MSVLAANAPLILTLSIETHEKTKVYQNNYFDREYFCGKRIQIINVSKHF